MLLDSNCTQQLAHTSSDIVRNFYTLCLHDFNMNAYKKYTLIMYILLKLSLKNLKYIRYAER